MHRLRSGVQMQRLLARLREASWLHLVQQLFGYFLVGAVILLLIGNREIKIVLKVILIGIFFGTMLIKYLLEIPVGWRRSSKAYHSGAGFWRSTILFHPPEFVALARLQWRLIVGFLRWALRRPPVVIPTGTHIGFLRRSSYPTVLIILALAILTEVPFSFVLLGATNLDPAIITRLHIFIGQVTILSFVFILGDRQYLLNSRHSLARTGLEIRMGARTQGFIPYSAIKGCGVLDQRERSFLTSPRRMQGDTLWITPFDRPNFCIELVVANTVSLSHFMLDRTNLKLVYLYVDDPLPLQAELRAAMASPPQFSDECSMPRHSPSQAVAAPT